ncbi:MAG: hypothetical protein QN187_14605 [Armatimonadota bacterium]|nr:hypothetical protein [Armatimonadota bacterium]MDR7520068.1 hypothetical protein [Armatimonadota bacterium]MDR7550770.1 hypothetical protein [Armatimonadota bacterium]
MAQRRLAHRLGTTNIRGTAVFPPGPFRRQPAGPVGTVRTRVAWTDRRDETSSSDIFDPKDDVDAQTIP